MRCILLALFISAILFGAQGQDLKPLVLDDFTTHHTFSPEIPREINPMNDGLHYSALVEGTKIVKFSFKTGKEVAVLFDLTTISDAPFKSMSAYSFSSNEQRILITTQSKRINRYSSQAEFYVWDFYTERFYPVSEFGPQRAATLSPDGERIAFVRDNNIYIKTIRFGTEYAVTTDGKANAVINGVPDWVYEEEFEYDKAFEWSPDSKMLAYVKFDEREVPEYKMLIYKGLSPEKNEYAVYPGETLQKYPKAGEKNSKVSVHVHDLKTKTTLVMDIGKNEDIYVPRIKWTPDSKDLVLFRLNRFQNELNILYANPNTGDSRTIMTEKNRRYIDEGFLDQFRFLDDQRHFVVLSERNGWSHLYLYRNNGFIVGPLTSGEFDVTRFYGYDQERKLFYYQAARKSPLQREIYAQSLDGKTDKLITSREGTNSALFSTRFDYLLNTYSSATTPPVVSILDRNGKEITLLEENHGLKQKISEYQWPSTEFFTFKTSEDVVLYGSMLKPSGFQPDKKYPVIVNQYSGPNSQEVTDSWSTDWLWFLAGQGYIVVSVDPRGTAARGEDFRKCTYLQLGKVESDDLIETARYLQSLDYVDAEHIGIWGWSYGGFTTALCMARGNGIFAAGVSVAPVTSWRYYDTVYTERFMRTPRDNPDGYDDNSPVSHAAGMKGDYLLIHGTADDNVHVQHSFEFSEALVQAGFQFDMQIYTNRNHGLSGGATRNHVYNRILNFFNNSLENNK